MTGEQLRALRERLGLSQTALAARLGVAGKSHVAYLESGRLKIAGPVALVLHRLAAGRLDESPADPADFPPHEVRRIRQALGLTLQQFAERLGLSSHSLAAKLETGAAGNWKSKVGSGRRHHRGTRVNWAKAILLKELSKKIPKKKVRSS